MEHYRISMETGKKKKRSKIIYVQVDNILEALDISKKQKAARLFNIIPISREIFEQGRDDKYTL
jgi:hypothetical protein